MDLRSRRPQPSDASKHASQRLFMGTKWAVASSTQILIHVATHEAAAAIAGCTSAIAASHGGCLLLLHPLQVGCDDRSNRSCRCFLQRTHGRASFYAAIMATVFRRGIIAQEDTGDAAVLFASA